jgi:hypothetical protein
MDKPILSKQAFWDVDMNKIDYKKNARYVVEKVVERGKAEDFENLLKFYGLATVKSLVLKSLWLSDVSVNFCCVVFDVKPTDFKCYEKKQLNRAHWDF